MSAEGISALILGATGAIGKEVLKEVMNSPKFSQVVIITRRNIEDISHPKVIQKVVDFDKLEEYKNSFEGVQVAFCCLGTTRSKAGAEGFVKVDRDYVYSAAKILKEYNCSHFHLVTSKGSNKNSSFLYMKTKGEVENMLQELKFQRLSIYRPSLLLCEREDSRPFEKVAQIFAKGFDWRNKLSIPVETVAHAMITNTFLPSKDNVEILENSQVNAVGID